MCDAKSRDKKRVRNEELVKDILPLVSVKKQSLSSQKSLSCVIITHWLAYQNPENSALHEILEFVWAVYDLQSNTILEKTRYIVQPTELCLQKIPNCILKMLNIEDYHSFEKAKLLSDVLLELTTAVDLMQCRGVCTISGCNKLQKELLQEIFRKNISVPNCLKSFLDLSTLLLQFYPKCFACLNEFHLSPLMMAKRLQIHLPEKISETCCMDDCLIMCAILKKITLDSFHLQEEHISTLVVHSVTPLQEQDFCNTKQTSLQLCNQKSESDDSLFIRLRGVPWGISKNDIVQFIQPVCSVSTSNVYIGTNKNGKVSGEVYVKLETQSQRDQCVHELHRRYIGSRWIEVFKASPLDLHQISILGESPYDKWGAVRLRGLPWSIHESDVVKFFAEAGLSISACCVILGKNHQGHFNGDAWVVLATLQHAENAKQLLDKKMLKKRYIEVFLSTIREVQVALHEPFLKSHFLSIYKNKSTSSSTQDPFTIPSIASQTDNISSTISPTTTKPIVACSTSLPYKKTLSPIKAESPVLFNSYQPISKVPQSNFLRSSVLRMRGLPYHATQKNILSFFNGFAVISILPTTGLINGKPSGEAYVEFTTAQEAWKAFSYKNGALMEHRYIELFFAKKQDMQTALLKISDSLQIKKKTY